jgi:hypothetical protein
MASEKSRVAATSLGNVHRRSPRHRKARQDLKFWRAFFFLQETTLQETRHFSGFPTPISHSWRMLGRRISHRVMATQHHGLARFAKPMCKASEELQPALRGGQDPTPNGFSAGIVVAGGQELDGSGERA